MKIKLKKLDNTFDDGPCHVTKAKYCKWNNGCCIEPYSYPERRGRATLIMSLKNHAPTRNGKMPKNQKATATIEKLAYPSPTFKLIKKMIKKIKRKRKRKRG
jgi:hypothetical protein